MNSDKIKNIIEELVQLDPNLAGKEEEIKKIIEDFVALRPIVNYDENFKSDLRSKLQTLISSWQATADRQQGMKNHRISVFSRIKYVGIGSVMSLLIITPVLVFLIQEYKGQRITDDEGTRDGGQQIADNRVQTTGDREQETSESMTTELAWNAHRKQIANSQEIETTVNTLDANAFGSLAMLSSNSATSVAWGMGGSPVAQEGMRDQAMIMPPQWQTFYEYVYTGTSFPTLNASYKVFQETANLDFSKIDVRSVLPFGENVDTVTIKNIGFSDAGTWGYEYYINENGDLNISKKYDPSNPDLWYTWRDPWTGGNEWLVRTNASQILSRFNISNPNNNNILVKYEYGNYTVTVQDYIESVPVYESYGEPAWVKMYFNQSGDFNSLSTKLSRILNASVYSGVLSQEEIIKNASSNSSNVPAYLMNDQNKTIVSLLNPQFIYSKMSVYGPKWQLTYYIPAIRFEVGDYLNNSLPQYLVVNVLKG